tara:strand:- start:153 stop:500 length:348 start_codon:yes stop_codon:yes gene_type:complete
MTPQVYDLELALYTKNLIERDHLHRDNLDKIIDNYVLVNNRKHTTKRQKSMFYKIVERKKIDLAIKMAVQHFTKLMTKFARFFTYIFRNPLLSNGTFQRLSRGGRPLNRYRLYKS